MSQVRINALRPEVPAKTADYIDAKLAQLQVEHQKAMAQALAAITQRLDIQTQRLDDLEESVIHLTQAQRSDDKYSLTKAKLIRLMKELGINDG